MQSKTYPWQPEVDGRTSGGATTLMAAWDGGDEDGSVRGKPARLEDEGEDGWLT